MLWLVFHITLLAFCSAALPHFSERDDFPNLGSYFNVPTPAPVVGVLTQPTNRMEDGKQRLYVPASYIKYVEVGGARAVPIFPDRSIDELKSIFPKLNGLLVPGAPTNSVWRLQQPMVVAVANRTAPVSPRFML